MKVENKKREHKRESITKYANHKEEEKVKDKISERQKNGGSENGRMAKKRVNDQKKKRVNDQICES